MPLSIEVLNAELTLGDLDDLQNEHQIRLSGRAEMQPNGVPAFYVSWARLPTYLFQAAKLPEKLQVRYTYRDKLWDNGAATQGEYAFEGIELMIVTHGKDNDLKQLFSFVEIIGRDLKKINEALEQLRVGVLRPSKIYSSPGLTAAPVAASANDTEEGSGQLSFPPMAAQKTKAA